MRRWAVIALVAAAGGCGLEEGESCRTGIGECEDARQGLYCYEGRAIRLQCRGEDGCVESGGMVFRCDQSVAEEGDLCTTDGGAACSPDGRTFLTCQSGRYASVARCGGPRGCFRDRAAGLVQCDESVADVGDHCTGGAACSTDRRGYLVCVDGAFAASLRCAEGCEMEGSQIRCQGPRATAGAPCGEGGLACSEAADATLQCANGAWSVHRQCRGARGCFVEDRQVFCDESIATEGDRCESGAACTADGSAFLECRDGAFVQTHRCPGGCRIEDDGRVLCMRR